jgi:ABC-type molybdate transport system substrate-binding protein
MGKVAKALLEKNGLAQLVERNVVERPAGHEKAAVSVDGERVDATIMWVWAVRELAGGRVEAVPIPPGQNVCEAVEAMGLTTGQNRAAGEKFVTYLQCPQAREILYREGLLMQK